MTDAFAAKGLEVRDGAQSQTRASAVSVGSRAILSLTPRGISTPTRRPATPSR